jgi:hypothetical protein
VNKPREFWIIPDDAHGGNRYPSVPYVGEAYKVPQFNGEIHVIEKFAYDELEKLKREKEILETYFKTVLIGGDEMADLKAKLNIAVKALEFYANEEIYTQQEGTSWETPDGQLQPGYFTQIKDHDNDGDKARQALGKINANAVHEECICGEINARNCPVHQTGAKNG